MKRKTTITHRVGLSMKHVLSYAFCLSSIITHTSSLEASVPLRWTVETSRVQPAVFDVVHGESIELEAVLQSYGNPLSMACKSVSIFWQTNGMESAWWSAPATVRAAPSRPGASTPTNVLAATFTPAMDPGAATVTGFLGATGDIYRAAFTLRFRKGPGATPNVIEQPPRVLDLANTVVINPPWPTQADFVNTTTVMKAELKAYVDGEIEGAGLITHQTVTNISSSVTSNIVTKAYVESLGIESGLDTNAVATVITNHVTSGYLCTVESATAKANEAIEAARCLRTNDFGVIGSEITVEGKIESEGDIETLGSVYSANSVYAQDFTAVDGSGAYFGDYFFKDNVYFLPWSSSYGSDPTHDLALRSQFYGKAESDARYAPTSTSATVTQLNVQVQALGANANAEDARVIVTNYNSATRMAEAQFDVKVSNSWITVWHEMTRWNWFLGEFTTFTNGVASALANKGEKEWGWFDSATGSPSPDGILQLAQPRIQICSGAAYQRYASTAGSYWVLESNGLVADINGTTNGYFRITDEEGNAHFEIVKGDKQSLFAKAKTMTSQVMGVTHYFTTYAITNAVSTPVAEFSRSLSSPVWIKESESGHPCNVRWTNNGDNSWTVEWWPIGNEPVLFMRAGYERGGETYIRNVVPVSMQYIYLGNTKYLLGTATIDGHTVLTLTAQ